MRNGDSFVGLLKDFTQQIKAFIREEAQLAKAELSEKLSRMGSHAVNVAVGGFVAYAGLMVFLGSLGLLLAFAFEKLGLPPLLAAVAGLAIIGLIVLAVGGILVMKGIKAFSKESLTPRRTIETLQYLKGTQVGCDVEPAPKIKEKARTSEEIEASVLALETQMGETFEELADRITFTHFRKQAETEVHNHPYRWGLVAMGTGLAGSYLLKRKLSHSKT